MTMVMRLAPFFPARILSGTAIRVDRTGGAYTINMDWSQIQQSSLPVDPENFEFTLLNTDGSFIRVPVPDVILPQVTWSTLSGKPSTFPPSPHTHPISDVNLLQSTLDGINLVLAGKVDASAIIDPMHGGTGLSSFATGDLIYAGATDTLAKRAAGTDGYVLTMAAGVPDWAAPATAPAGAVINARSSLIPTTSGTSKNYTTSGTVKRFRLMLDAVSTNGSDSILVQIGTGGVATTSGYVGSASILPSGAAIVSNNPTTGAAVTALGGSALAWSGWIEFALTDASTNTWSWNGGFGVTGASTITAGSVSLAGALNYIVLTTVGGTDTFDAGSFSVEYDTTL